MDLPERALLFFTNCSNKDYLFKHHLNIFKQDDDIIIETQLKDDIFFKGIRLTFKKDPLYNIAIYRAKDEAGIEYLLSCTNDDCRITRISDNTRFIFNIIPNY